jgi:hypothetical protein
MIRLFRLNLDSFRKSFLFYDKQSARIYQKIYSQRKSPDKAAGLGYSKTGGINKTII